MRTHRLPMFVLCLAACAGDDDFSPGSPPGPGGTGKSPDASVSVLVDGGQTQPGISGVVCQLGDVRVLAACVSAGAGLTVSLDGVAGSTLTAADGTFTLPAQPGQNDALVLAEDSTNVLAGSAVRVTLDASGLGSVTVPMLAQADLAEILIANNELPDLLDVGQVVVVASDGVMTLSGASFNALEGLLPYYDVGDIQLFSADATETIASGFAMYMNVAPGNYTLGATRATEPIVIPTPVRAAHISFVRALFTQ
jgi:hypothetical protein